jgi:hypothetical protein
LQLFSKPNLRPPGAGAAPHVRGDGRSHLLQPRLLCREGRGRHQGTRHHHFITNKTKFLLHTNKKNVAQVFPLKNVDILIKMQDLKKYIRQNIQSFLSL